jgi:hypothetical protein
MMVRRGFPEAAARIQELFLARRRPCPTSSATRWRWSVRPPARIRERYRAWAACGITGVTVSTAQPEALELMAALARESR